MRQSWTGVLLALLFAVAPAAAADAPDLTRMATCRDSWLDWQKTAPAALQKFGESFRTQFAPNGNQAFMLPRKPVSVAGLRVLQAFPQSVGMGVGFSLTVDANFDKTRKAMEALLGKRLTKCEAGDGMNSCELEIADQRTFTLMAGDNDKSRTLVGCYYYYEK
jgi:hypothetical protein